MGLETNISWLRIEAEEIVYLNSKIKRSAKTEYEIKSMKLYYQAIIDAKCENTIRKNHATSPNSSVWSESQATTFYQWVTNKTY